MKTFKLILNCLIPTLLVFSIILNIFLLSGFKLVKGDPVSHKQHTTSAIQKDPGKKTSAKNELIVESTTTADSCEPNEPNSDNIIYQDTNIKITYIRLKECTPDHTYEFEIENTSSKTLSVLFTDLYINDKPVYTSGLTCDKVLPGIVITEDLVLLVKEWEQFTTSPNKVSFKIKLINEKSKLDLYETDRIILTFK